MSDVSSIAVPSTHPAIAGHFPGNPIVPGAVLLSYVVAQAAATGMAISGIKRCKFLRLVKPEQPFCINIDAASGKFSIVAGDQTADGLPQGEIIAKGSLLLHTASAGASSG